MILYGLGAIPYLIVGLLGGTLLFRLRWNTLKKKGSGTFLYHKDCDCSHSLRDRASALDRSALLEMWRNHLSFMRFQATLVALFWPLFLVTAIIAALVILVCAILYFTGKYLGLAIGKTLAFLFGPGLRKIGRAIDAIWTTPVKYDQRERAPRAAKAKDEPAPVVVQKPDKYDDDIIDGEYSPYTGRTPYSSYGGRSYR
jgi:hypothetical protein